MTPPLAGLLRIPIAPLLLAASLAGCADKPVLPERHPPVAWLAGERLDYRSAPFLRKAARARTAGDEPEVERLLRELLAGDPGHNQARLWLAEVCTGTGKPAEALALYAELIRAYPDMLDLYLRKGALAAAQANDAEAIATFQALLGRAPPDYPPRREVVRTLADLCLRAGRLDDARTYGQLWAAWEQGPDALRMLAERARLAGEWSNYFSRVDQLLASLTDPEERAPVRARSALTLARLQRWPEAVAAMRLAEQEWQREARPAGLPTTDDVVLARIRWLMRAQRWDEARKTGDQALQANPAVPVREEWATLAAAAPEQRQQVLRDGLHPAALEWQAEVRRALGLAAFHRGDLAAADDHLARAALLEPDRWEIQYLRGLVALARKDFPAAERCFTAFDEAAAEADAQPRKFWEDLGGLPPNAAL